MKKLILIFSLCCLAVGQLAAQCTNTSSFGSATVNTTGSTVTISTCSFAGEYSTISGAVSGQTLKFTSSAAGDIVTIHSGSPSGPVLGTGAMPFTLANTFTGTIYAHWNTAGCGAQSTCRTTTVQCVSCVAPPPVNPCNSILPASCGVNQTVTLTGAGGGWNPGSCGFSTPGAEQVYTFTAPFTGVYTLNVTSGSGGFIDWFFKSTAGGCGSTGWTCIDDISASGSVTFNLSAGTYYILADGEGTTSRTQTWNISCVPPIDPCNTILPAVCGTSQTVTLTGTGGGWNVSSCGFSTPGAEQVYSFTAPTTGTYTLDVTNGSGGFVDYFFKSTASGCGPNGWTCIDDISTSGTVTFTLTAGTYYILLDGEGTSARTQTWSITCPQPAPANDDCANAITLACGQTVTGSTQFATPDVAPSCNGFSVGTGGAVWYKFVGNGGFVTLSTCSGNTNYDTKLHVYDGSCSALNCVTANDDDATCGTSTLSSKVTFCTVAGNTYYVLVNGFLSAQGNFALSVDCNPPAISISPVSPLCVGAASVTLSASLSGGTFSGPGVSGNVFNPAAAGPGVHTITYSLCSVTATTTITVLAAPANDLVANAEPLSCGSSAVGNTTCATSETLGTCGTTDGTGGGVWYAMVGNGNRITLTTCNSVTDFDTKLRVFTGTPTALTCLGGVDDDANCTTGPGTAGFKSTFSFCSEPGVTYYILVHGFSSAVGNFKLESSCSPVNPVIASCAPAQTGNLDGSCSFLVPDYTALVSATDDCGVTSISQSPAAGSTVNGAGVHPITFTVTDAGGNTAVCSSTLTLSDISIPNAVCQAVTVILDGSGNGTLTAGEVNNGSTDNCGIASLAIDNGAFSCSNTGSNNIVTLTVTDVNGLTATCNATVTVVDNIAPTIDCNAAGINNGPNNSLGNDVVLPNDLGVCGAAFSFTNDVNDNCPNFTVAQTAGLVSGSIFPVGTTTNSFLVTDASGNTAACSFNVTVNDIELPVLSCPANITVTAPSGQCSTTVTYTVPMSDNCGIASSSITPASGSVFSTGNTTVTATATDVNGNVATCTFNVHVNAVNTITLWGVPCNTSALCSAIPAAPSIVGCPPTGNGGSGSGYGHHGCNNGNHGSYHNYHNVCNYANGSGSGSGHNYHGYNGLMTNPCGNGGSGSGSGHHGSGNHGSNCNTYCVSSSCGVYATSKCGPCPTVVMTTTTIPGTCANNYTLVRTWTATDAYGNSLSQSQSIAVYDNVKPSINCPNDITVCVPMNNNTGRTVTYNVTASDNCGAATITTTKASGSLFAIGNTYVTATATDACGNARSCTFRVRVERRNNCNSRMADDEPSAEAAKVATGLSINAFPNPTTGLVDVEIMCEDCVSDHAYDLTVTDLYGKVLSKHQVQIVDGLATLKLDLSQYAAGIYMVNINNMMTKVVKN